MAYVFWLILLTAVAAGTFFLRRHRQARKMDRQMQSLRIASELGRQIKVISTSLLSWPMREGCAIVFETTAALLASSPLESLADNLRREARLLRASRPTASATLLPANIRRQFENVERQLVRVSQLKLIQAREYALAHSAMVLAMELAGVDILVQEARVASVLKEKERSELLKAQALACCARLPAKTAEEMRKRVHASVAV